MKMPIPSPLDDKIVLLKSKVLGHMPGVLHVSADLSVVQSAATRASRRLGKEYNATVRFYVMRSLAFENEAQLMISEVFLKNLLRIEARRMRALNVSAHIINGNGALRYLYSNGGAK